MSFIKIAVFVCLSLILLTGCSSEAPLADYKSTELYPEGFDAEPLPFENAVSNVAEHFENTDNNNICYSVDTIDFINSRIYYIVRRYENLPDHIASLGMFAVDALTGEIYDTNFLTDLIPLGNSQD